ncbi:MAG: hypothetical protein SFU86_00045 [Pirellulaceae bacterium]|nr:hypothetical protein [Pirellulaceae bacterium]
MMPMDIGLSESSSTAFQLGDFKSGTSVSFGGTQGSVWKYAIVGLVAVLALSLFLVLRK